MATINQLKKQLAKERRKLKSKKAIMKVSTEKTQIKKELFDLKHGGKIKMAKNFGGALKRGGSNLKEAFGDVSAGFKKQRKGKYGIGGFLQKIADAQ